MRPLLLCAVLCMPLLAASDAPAKRLNESAAVLQDIMSAPDKGIPHDLIEKAHCIVIIPALKKGAFVIGGEYGKGFMSCRRENGNWSAPAAVRMEGGSVGFQIGGSDTDVVMLVMNARGEDKLLSSQFTLGAEGEVAAGPVGRTSSADTDALMTAEVLSWSRSKGLFAGISLKGATLRQDTEDNQALYGRKIDNREIVTSGIAPPPAATRLLGLLGRYPSHMTRG